MKQKVETIALRTKAMAIIEQADVIIEEYRAKGFTLTLRQLYYQFVSRGLLANLQKNYKMLGEVISSGRRAGLIDWDAIVDRTRFLREKPSWTSPKDILSACANQYRRNLWNDQPVYVECWFEKDALLGVFESITSQWRLPLFSCRGYVSDSELWSAARRFQSAGEKAEREKLVVLHFGDHDPSGIDMTRDIEDRLRLFGCPNVTVTRLALNMVQINKYNPPPNPAKESDSRFTDYAHAFGTESWELDALSPEVLKSILDSHVVKMIDWQYWDKSMEREEKERKELSKIAGDYKTKY